MVNRFHKRLMMPEFAVFAGFNWVLGPVVQDSLSSADKYNLGSFLGQNAGKLTNNSSARHRVELAKLIPSRVLEQSPSNLLVLTCQHYPNEVYPKEPVY